MFSTTDKKKWMTLLIVLKKVIFKAFLYEFIKILEEIQISSRELKSQDETRSSRHHP